METFARIPPYMIGILLGWLLHKTKDRRIDINRVFFIIKIWTKRTNMTVSIYLKSLIATGWILAAIIGSLVTYGIYPYLDEKTVPVINPFVRVSYGALHHSAWAITVGWIIFACTHGYGGLSKSSCVHWNCIVLQFIFVHDRYYPSIFVVETFSPV